MVGARPTLPIKGMSLLLGNDLAGDKVVADPRVTSKLITLVSIEKLGEDVPDIFSPVLCIKTSYLSYC